MSSSSARDTPSRRRSSLPRFATSIYEDLREKKERLEMAAFFSHLQDTATIDNFLVGKTTSACQAGQPRPL